MKVKYELYEDDIKKVLARYFEVPVEDIDLQVFETTKGYGMQEYTGHEVVVEIASQKFFADME